VEKPVTLTPSEDVLDILMQHFWSSQRNEFWEVDNQKSALTCVSYWRTKDGIFSGLDAIERCSCVGCGFLSDNTIDPLIRFFIDCGDHAP
jgi:hypothetical protein